MERKTRGIFYRAEDGEGRVAFARLAIDAMCKLCDEAGRDRMDREYRATIRGQFVAVPTDERGEPMEVSP